MSSIISLIGLLWIQLLCDDEWNGMEEANKNYLISAMDNLKWLKIQNGSIMQPKEGGNLLWLFEILFVEDSKWIEQLKAAESERPRLRGKEIISAWYWNFSRSSQAKL